MSAVEPLFSHHAATDVLKNLFSPASGTNPAEIKSEKTGNAVDSKTVSINARSTAKTTQPKTDDESAEEQSEEQEVPQAEAKEISAEPNDNVHVDHFITQPEESDELAHLTKTDLVHVLETFVNVLMESKEKADQGAHANLPRSMSFEPRDGNDSFNEVILSKNAEIDELKSLLVEAQGTIITLLTDRVEDKAKLATFESQMRYLPDYQRLHSQPTASTPSSPAPALDAEELRADLTKVKDELQNMKLTAYKTGIDGPKWSGLKGWFARFSGK